MPSPCWARKYKQNGGGGIVITIDSGLLHNPGKRKAIICDSVHLEQREVMRFTQGFNGNEFTPKHTTVPHNNNEHHSKSCI